MVATGAAVVQAAMRYAGYRYVLGAKGGGGATDCSGLVWLALRDLGIVAPHGTVNQFPWCERHGEPGSHVISVAEAIETPGAGLFIWRGAGGGGGRGNHVAISRGDGTTIEARSSRARPQVGVHTAHNRGWTHGVKWPGVSYSAPPPPPAPGPGAGILHPGFVLGPGNVVLSPNGRYALIYQHDGNLVLYDSQAREPNGSWQVHWASHTPFGCPGHVIMQPDGNLVVYGGLGHVGFATGTHGKPNAWAAVQDDGNFVIYHGAVPVWATNTHE